MYPPARVRAESPAPRLAELYGRYESSVVTVPAGTSFTEVVRFSGRPERVRLEASATGLEFRLRNRGEAEESAFRVLTSTPVELALGREIVEVRDPAGAGGQLVTVVALWASAPESL